MKVLMLTPWMKMGYGVSEAIASMTPHLADTGIAVTVGCLGSDRGFRGLDLRTVRPDPVDVLGLAAKTGASVVVAHGSPFFEVLPRITAEVKTLVFEYGDPTPEFFPGDDRATRRQTVADKAEFVYPNVTAVACISEFIRHDIGWPDARVIRLGVDHIADCGPKPWLPPIDPDRPLRVGTLMRLGSGEAHYKGNDLLPLIRDHIFDRGITVDFQVMGRGDEEDAALLRASGFTVHLNASDAERRDYLRNLDVFISASRWEGLNLPLVEAQALGTPALAFDTGAHPEFTPLIFPSVSAMVEQLGAYDSHRADLLQRHGRLCYRFVREGLSWESTAVGLAAMLREIDTGKAAKRRPVRSRWERQVGRVRGSVSVRGVGGTARYLLRGKQDDPR